MRKRLLAISVLSWVFASSAFGQVFRASITGTVVDPSGAAIPAASVIATNLDTHAQVATKSAMDGNRRGDRARNSPENFTFHSEIR